MKTEVLREKVMNGHRGSDWSDVAARRGKSSFVGYHQKLGGEKEGFFLESLMERGPANTLISDVCPPEPLEDIISTVVFLFGCSFSFLAAPSPSCGTWDLHCITRHLSLRHTDSRVVGHQLGCYGSGLSYVHV